MNPLFVQGDNFLILQGDSYDLLRDPSAPHAGSQHVITDPPYDNTTHKGALTVSSNDPSFGIDLPDTDPATLAPLLLSSANGWVLSFCTFEQLGHYQQAAKPWSAGGHYVRSGIWTKPNATPQLSGDRPATPGEAIAIMHSRPGPLSWNGGGKAAHWSGNVEFGAKAHAAAKPLWLMVDLVLKFTKPGDTIFDPFMGSGSTGVAALLHGRKFIGYEVDDSTFDKAIERLEHAERGIAMRDEPTNQGSLV